MNPIDGTLNRTGVPAMQSEPMVTVFVGVHFGVWLPTCLFGWISSFFYSNFVDVLVIWDQDLSIIFFMIYLSPQVLFPSHEFADF